MMAHAPTAPASNRRMGDLGSRLVMLGAAMGLIGIVLSLLIALVSDAEGAGWARFLRSYLTAFEFVLSICLGALFFTILQHCVKAGWSVVVRRLAEGVAANLIWIWILFLPIFIAVLAGNSHLYHWMHPGGDEVLQHKSPWFFFTNPMVWRDGQWVQEGHVPWFWLLRAVLFLGLWAFLANFFWRNSVLQDSTGDINLTRRMEQAAPVAVGLYFISSAFASIDWVMSLEPHWFSTMFPVYFFAASCCGWFAVQALMMFVLQRNNRLRSEITPEHYQDAGKLLFAFGIVFWAYIAFSQYMLIWYADLPEETPWYMVRQMGGWGWISLLLLFGHFAGPFLLLMSRHPKRLKTALAAAAGWMLFVHFIDIYWLVMPHVPEAIHYVGDPENVFTTNEGTIGAYRALADAVGNPNGAIASQMKALPEYKDGDLEVNFGFNLLDLACVVGLTGLVIAATAKRLSGVSLIPERDPRLHESLAFENA